jgi:hypothetical protein
MEKRKLIIGIALLVVFAPLVVSAVALPTPSSPVGGTGISMLEIGNTIQAIARWLIVISVVVAVIMIIWGGIMYMWARGDDDAVKNATATIKNGIIGAAIVLAVGVIMQTIALVVSRGFFNG